MIFIKGTLTSLRPLTPPRCRHYNDIMYLPLITSLSLPYLSGPLVAQGSKSFSLHLPVKLGSLWRSWHNSHRREADKSQPDIGPYTDTHARIEV